MRPPDTTPYPAPAGPPDAAGVPRPFAVRGYGLTDPGRVRPANEDHFAVVELARTLTVRHTSVPQAQSQHSTLRGHVFLVADGLGGHRAGAVASALAALTVEGFLLDSL